MAKPCSNAEIVETIVNTLFRHFSNFKPIQNQISNIEISHTTYVRRIKYLENQIFDSLNKELVK